MPSSSRLVPLSAAIVVGALTWHAPGAHAQQQQPAPA